MNEWTDEPNDADIIASAAAMEGLFDEAEGEITAGNIEDDYTLMMQKYGTPLVQDTVQKKIA